MRWSMSLWNSRPRNILAACSSPVSLSMAWVRSFSSEPRMLQSFP